MVPYPYGRTAMKSNPGLEFVFLAAVWGGSFLFMRVAAPSFGPFALMLVRCGVATLVLVPLAWLLTRSRARERTVLSARTWGQIAVSGILNSALPFLCFGYAALYLPAGVSSLFNATTPIFGALIAWLWLSDRPTLWRAIGLALGLAGVAVISFSRIQEGGAVVGWAVLVILGGPLCYGIAGSFTRRYLSGVDPAQVAAGSQVGAALFLLLPGLLTWPDVAPSTSAWGNAIALGVVSTGFAYLIFFRLIARLGPARALTVTFLIPVFAVLWGWLFLGETLDAATMAGGLVVLAGTALATGAVDPARRRR